jgi:hypothetical protein
VVKCEEKGGGERTDASGLDAFGESGAEGFGETDVAFFEDAAQELDEELVGDADIEEWGGRRTMVSSSGVHLVGMVAVVGWGDVDAEMVRIW